ncbi:hypothetical protein MPSEU_000439500 [Mayamaea pseudoterrestris]|nr:hypothetical protein MPSEU_000439500 [Mayamaea pseudoterrestris]
MMASSPSASQSVSIRVLVACTGTTYKISLHPSELTVANIRGHLAAAVPANDQILLIGPPYKVVKDSTLQSDETLNSLRLGDAEDDPIPEHFGVPHKILATTERTGARRLFLFSKQSLSEHAPDPTPCHLEPMDVYVPQEPPGPSPLSLDPVSSPPLHQALAAYERQFMLYSVQGRSLADGADLRLAACKTCVQEQAVMARALRAAVSNLSETFNSATRTRAEFASGFQAKITAQGSLLQRFESILNNLAAVPLHPSLVSTARASGRSMETLLDTVPVERERNWAQQCSNSHQRLMTLFQSLEQAFGEMGTPATREQEGKLDREAELEIETLWSEVEGFARDIRDRQSERSDSLTADHGKVVRMIIDAINADNDDQVQAAFTPFREMSESSKRLIPAMAEDDQRLKEFMYRVAEAKTNAMKRMKNRLRDVSIAQSSIHRILSSVGVLRDALTQQSENMVHLEHVAELPDSYRSFITEIQRRRAFGHAVTACSNAMMERLAAMRDDEVKAREKFLRGPGRHLMPAFFEIFAPTLASPPPLFTPQLPSTHEVDALPEVGMSPRGDTLTDAVMRSAANDDNNPVSSASTLTTESHQVRDHEMALAAAAQQNQDQLIVSASDQSGNDLILDPAGGAAADAEAKTLAYENAVLRQALERLGGKPPRSYIDDAKAQDGTTVDDAEVAALRKELSAVKAQVRLAKEEGQQSLMESKRLSDKISHSSFEIGDIGLFMPTGRGSGGKRTYLAFHTKCPYRFLSTDCIKGAPDYVLGRIVFQEELVAGELGTDANPYGLPVGTKFWVLTVEVLQS